MNKDKKILNLALIGCGNIGFKRISNLPKCYSFKGCFDINIQKATELCKTFGGIVFESYEKILENRYVDVVVISTTHNAFYEICMKCIQSNKHVFLEKPGGKSLHELEQISFASKKQNVKIGIGFNHRFHRSIMKAKKIINDNEIGDLMFMRARYGHGGRKNYNKEWRALPELSGGGELIDQGSHLIDLTRHFLGEIKSQKSMVKTYFWDMKVDDNAFMILETNLNKTSFLHVSCTEWKNTFSLEIYGKKGKIDIFGLGGSYGTERITLYTMLPQMGPPDSQTWEYLTPDLSWKVELEEFYQLVLNQNNNMPTIQDAVENMKIISEIYKDNNYDFS